MDISQYLQLGAVAIIFIFAIKEFFGFLKVKKNGNNGGLNKQILEELKAMNENHLKDISDQIQRGNDKLVEAIHNDNMLIIASLGEIKGKLTK